MKTRLSRQFAQYGVTLEPRSVDGLPGAVLRTADEEIANVFSIDIADGQVQAIRGVINPDKLHHLGPVADVRAHQARQ